MQVNLNVLMMGFKVFEQRILETTAKLSSSRGRDAHSPVITLVNEQQLQKARIVFIDGKDDDSMEWARENESILSRKTVVWIDTQGLKPNIRHAKMNRPILWVNLPIIAVRILEEESLRKAGKTGKGTTSGAPKANRSKAARAQASRIQNSRTPIGKAKAPTKGHVMVVDDSNAIRGYLTKMLRKNGYTVSAAETGEKAIEIAENTYFDCILMDVLMPGIDGYKACRTIRRLKQHRERGAMSVVMLTSRTSPFDKIRGKMAGCHAYLTKPVKMVTLMTAVEKYSKK